MLNSKFLMKCTAIVLSAIMFFGCVPSAFAYIHPSFVYDPDSDSNGIKEDVFFTPGEVLVGITEEAEKTMSLEEIRSHLKELFPNDEIDFTDLYWANYTNEDGTSDEICHSVFCLVFKEKSKEIVWKAIDILNNSPYVYFAQPDYNAEVRQYHPGEVLFYVNEEGEYKMHSLIYKEEWRKEFLPGLEYKFTHSAMYVGDGSGYSIKFTEETCEMVWKAIELLKNCPYVLTAEPIYYGRWTDIGPTITFPYVDSNDKNVKNTNPVTDPTNTVTVVNDGDKNTDTTNPVTDVKGDEKKTEPEDTQTNFVKGDADGDGELSVKDATCIQMYLANLISEQNIDYSAAIVSGTGTVTINDATMIQMKLAGLLNDW